MRRQVRWMFYLLLAGSYLAIAGCGANTVLVIPANYTLSVISDAPAAGVPITVSPADKSNLSSGHTSLTRTYTAGTIVTVSAPASMSGVPFSSWSGCTSSSGLTCSVSMSSDVTVTVKYAEPPPSTYTLTVDSSIAGVDIGISPADANNAGGGATSLMRTYAAGTTITLTAPATADSEAFDFWSGCTATSAVTCSVVLNANKKVEANYTATPPTAPITYDLTVSSKNPDSAVPIAVSPTDNNNANNGYTGFSRTYNAGSTVVLIAPAAAAGNAFSSWTGCSSTGGLTCVVTLNANAAVSANYVTPVSAPPPPTRYSLAVATTNPATGVTIGASPADSNSLTSGTSAFTLMYASGTQVTLTAPATTGTNTFATWSGCASTTGLTCTVTVNANTTVTANYITPKPGQTVYGLTTASTNPNSGVSINASPADVDSFSSGPTPITLEYVAGTSVVVTAPSTAGGNPFASWTGCTTTSGLMCTVTVNASGSITANYTAPSPNIYSLTVGSMNPNSGVAIKAAPADSNNVSGGSSTLTLMYAAGSQVTLTAPATAGGNAFASWTGCTSTNGMNCAVTVNANTVISANYTEPPTPPVPAVYNLTVDSTNPSSGVVIAASPADANSVSSGATSVTLNYVGGTQVTLTAPGSASNGDPFLSWSGCTSASTNTCTVAVNANTKVTANYTVPVPPAAAYSLTVNSTDPTSGVAVAVSPVDNNNASSGTTSLTRTYNSGTTIKLTAPATSGSNIFSSWSGCTSSNATVCTVKIKSNTTVSAAYSTPAPPPATVTLTVLSSNPANGVAIAVSPADSNNATDGTSSFTRAYAVGTTVTLTAPATWGGNPFGSWTGCTTTSTVTCTVQITANATVIATYTNPAPTAYTLTVASANPSSGVSITTTPADNNNATNGTTSFTRIYNAGTSVTLSAPSTSNTYSFASWTGCASSNATTCNITMNGNATVTAVYNAPVGLSVVVTPTPVNVAIGTQQQFTATVTGPGNPSQAVTWSLLGPLGNVLSPGTITSSGLYTTPYPAPPTVTVIATSQQTPLISGIATVTLVAPTVAAPPTLSVDAGNKTRSISPYVYGMNAYELSFSGAAEMNLPLTRWGGDATSRYNYAIDATSQAFDYYFENRPGNTSDGQNAVNGQSAFNALVNSNKAIGAATLGTVPVMGWVAKDTTSCSFPRSTYPNQYAFDTYFPCGDGELPNQNFITGNDPTVASTAVTSSWTGSWISSLVSQFGTASNGGVGFYDLDNEPSWWDVVQRDVHPAPTNYDEITNNGLAAAAAIKASDATAEVSGPVVDYWWNFFYSKQEIEAGWSNGAPCYGPWSNPADRTAHGGVPFIEYYLQQFAAYQAAHGIRLLDYVDIHGYFSAYYPVDSNNQTNSDTAGDTGEQQARVNSTRALWDSTYTDPHYTQPNYLTDSNYTTDYCIVPLQAPQLIPMMQGWVAKRYPGTKTSISEYMWGAMESVNGAIAQADVLGIFGAYGLDMATMWQPPNPVTQIPGMKAFEIYRNYDGKNSLFGDQALASVSSNQGQLSIYGSQRTADGALTIVVINKTYGDLSTSLTVANFTPVAGATAQDFLYSNSNLLAIVPQSPLTITPPAQGGKNSSITSTFPAQSITLIVIPTK